MNGVAFLVRLLFRRYAYYDLASELGEKDSVQSEASEGRLKRQYP